MKKRITAIILTLCFTFILMPFSVVKAYVAYYGEYSLTRNNVEYGKVYEYWFVPDDYYQSPTQELIDMDILGNLTDSYVHGVYYRIQFNSYCNGSIQINFDNGNWADYRNISGDGIINYQFYNDSNDVHDNYVIIQLNDTSYIDIYLFVYSHKYINPDFWDEDYITDTYDLTNVIIGGNLPYDYLTYQIPDDRIMAFNFFLNIGDYIHYDTHSNYPYINISTSKSTSIYVHDDDEIIIAYFTSDVQAVDRTVKGLFNITRSGVGPWSLTETQLVDYNKYRVGTGYFIAAKLKVDVNIPATSTVTLTFTPKYERSIRPIYFGLSSNYMSEETRNLLGLDNLVNNPNEDMDDIADDLGDLHDEENDIIGGFESDLTDFNTDMDLDDYDFITDLNDSNTYFKMVLNDVFTNSSSVRAFWVIPLILVIITALLGR